MKYFTQPTSTVRDRDLARTDGRGINRKVGLSGNYQGSFYNEVSELIPAPPRHSGKLIGTRAHFPEKSN